MAEYRTVRMAFWNDPFVEELDAKGKLLYLYLFTSPYTNNFGIIEVTRKKISFETGISTQEVEKYLDDLEAGKKIVTDGGWIWLVNFIKNQTKTSPRIIDGLIKDAPSSVPTKKIAEAICRMYPHVYKNKIVDGDTYTIPTPLGSHTYTHTCRELERELEYENGKEEPPLTPPAGKEGDASSSSPPETLSLTPRQAETNTRATGTNPRAEGKNPRAQNTNPRAKPFVPPSEDEVDEYCLERSNGISGRDFCDHYSARGWMLGKSRMKDWRAAVRTWENRRAEERRIAESARASPVRHMIN